MENQIREAAYYKWLEAGCPSNGKNRLWIEAEEDILRRNGSYRLLLKDDTLEIRKYYPLKRTIFQAHYEYYLQCPYMIFAARHYKTGSYLYVGFAKESDDTFYFPSLPNICPQTWSICLTRGYNSGHFYNKCEKNLNKLIEQFWHTRFDSWAYGWEIGHRSLRDNFDGRFKLWCKLNLPQVLERIKYMPISFDEFVKMISKHYDSEKMKEMINDYTGCPSVRRPMAAEGSAAGCLSLPRVRRRVSD